MANHEEYCKNFDAVKINLPRKNENFLKFQDFNNSFRVPYVIYADLECRLEKQEDDLYGAAYQLGIDTIGKNPDNLVEQIKEKPGIDYKMDESKPYTIRYQKHIPDGFSFNIISENKIRLFHYVGKDAAKVFVQKMNHLSRIIKKIYNKVFPMKDLTDNEINNFNNATLCHILCNKELRKDRVRDHDHTNGNHRGAAHSNCNLNYKNPSFIPVFIHNLFMYI